MIDLLITLLQRFNIISPDLTHSKLFDDDSFYKQFVADLKHCKKEVIIESPYITSQRMSTLKRHFASLVARKVKVYVITRNPYDHDLSMRQQADVEIRNFEMMGVQVLINTDYNHRKVAILDRKILWEGSLNILSQTYSRELMRRISSKALANNMFQFLKLEKYIY